MTTDWAYEVTLLEQKIDKIRQVLFYYDNIPDDNRIVELVKEWREHNRRLRELGEDIVI